ncbi:MAG: WD40 repeat domain-containing protein [Cyclobacteriaceae bacterium]
MPDTRLAAKIRSFIIDLEKGKQVGTAVGHTNVVNGLAFTHNGKFLVSASDDATIIIWKVAEGSYAVAHTLAAGAPVKAGSLNPANQDLAVAIEGNADVVVYPLGGFDRGQTKFQPRSLKKHKGAIYKVAYSPDGQFLASSSDAFELNLWKPDGTFIKSLPSRDVVTAIAFSSDSKMMVVLDGAGNGESFGVPAGNKFSDFKGHDHTVQAAVFAPTDNGTYIVASAGGWNNEICLWNPFNGKLIRKIKGKGNSIEHLAFGQGLELYVDSKIDEQEQYTASYDFFTLKLNPNRYTPPIKNLNEGIKKSSEFKLDLPKGKSIELDPGVDGAILDYQATLEGYIIIASNFSLKMYDRNGYPMKEFVGHSGAVRSITLSPDERYLASGGIVRNFGIAHRIISDLEIGNSVVGKFIGVDSTCVNVYRSCWASIVCHR